MGDYGNRNRMKQSETKLRLDKIQLWLYNYKSGFIKKGGTMGTKRDFGTKDVIRLAGIPYQTLDRWIKAEEDNLVVVDVRAAEDFAKGHIPSAINLPKEHWHDPQGLNRDKTNVVYCYSQQCHLAANACVQFAASGFHTTSMDDVAAAAHAAGLNGLNGAGGLFHSRLLLRLGGVLLPWRPL